MAGVGVANADVFRAYMFYSAILCAKMLLLAATTGFQRIKRKVALNHEDIAALGKGAKLGTDETVERIRRAHLNDLENIVPFWIVALAYVHTDPNPTVAVSLFRIFTLARVVHSLVYVTAAPQPARGLAFGLGMLVLLYMTFSVASATL